MSTTFHKVVGFLIRYRYKRFSILASNDKHRGHVAQLLFEPGKATACIRCFYRFPTSVVTAVDQLCAYANPWPCVYSPLRNKENALDVSSVCHFKDRIPTRR